jgi:hypothetical protein
MKCYAVIAVNGDSDGESNQLFSFGVERLRRHPDTSCFLVADERQRPSPGPSDRGFSDVAVDRFLAHGGVQTQDLADLRLYDWFGSNHFGFGVLCSGDSTDEARVAHPEPGNLLKRAH